MASADDLVASGLIASLANPGGNITGVSMLITELDAKRLEVLKEILPSARRLGVLNDPATSGPAGLQAIAETAYALSVSLQTVQVYNPAKSLQPLQADEPEVSKASTSFPRRRSSAFVNSSAGCSSHKLAAICEWREMAASGCLMSYGTTLRELFAMQARLIDKMLKGARPGDTPAQQPTKFELVLYLKAAREVGVERSLPGSSAAPTRSSNNGVDGPERHLGARMVDW